VPARDKDSESASERRARKREKAAAAAANAEGSTAPASRAANLAKDWDDHLSPDAPAGRSGSTAPLQPRTTRKLAGSLTAEDL
jgi:hypothetical protein